MIDKKSGGFTGQDLVDLGLGDKKIYILFEYTRENEILANIISYKNEDEPDQGIILSKTGRI